MPRRRHKQPEWQAKTRLPLERGRLGTALQAQRLAQPDQVGAQAARLQLAAAEPAPPRARAESQPAAAVSELRTAQAAARAPQVKRAALARVRVNPALQLQGKAAAPVDRTQAQARVKPARLQLVAAQ